jgi:predicted Zn finger-like uncharacterized protein
MTLAARCPACGTVFRVVQDQLRVSEGWVRCGRCAEVFNAIDGLVELDAEAAVRVPPRQPGRDRVLEELARVTHAGDAPTELAPPRVPPAAKTAQAPAAVPSYAGATPGTSAPDIELPADDFDDSEFRAQPELRPAPGMAPEFVRRAERAARWRRPGVRIALGMTALAAAALLGAQVALEFRDLVAARWPESRSLLLAACSALGCRIEAPRSIDALAVESSGLVHIDATANYRLSVVLRNRAAIALAVPALDLTLTDSQGAVIARRVIGLAELGIRQRSVPAGAELPLQTLVATNERPISGYTIEIFYP